MSSVTVFIEPPYPSLNQNKLFESDNFQDPSMVIPFIEMRKHFKLMGIEVHTADFMRVKKFLSKKNYYFSFGETKYLDDPAGGDISINYIYGSFVAFETPLIQPIIYKKMKQIVASFSEVYAYNESLVGDAKKYKHLYFPAPYAKVNSVLWDNNERAQKFVMISGNHRPAIGVKGELYSKRLQILRYLGKLKLVDLYGRGWFRLFSRNSLWIDFWLTLPTIKRIYMGQSQVKLATLSQYVFCICYENLILNGYITEKIFDCFYAGCIPLYWGAIDIQDYIPKEAYIDVSSFPEPNDAIDFALSMSVESRLKMKQAGRDFIENNSVNYKNSIINIVSSGMTCSRV